MKKVDNISDIHVECPYCHITLRLENKRIKVGTYEITCEVCNKVIGTLVGKRSKKKEI